MNRRILCTNAFCASEIATAVLSLTAPVGRLTADAIVQVVSGLREAAESVANTLTMPRG